MLWHRFRVDLIPNGFQEAVGYGAVITDTSAVVLPYTRMHPLETMALPWSPSGYRPFSVSSSRVVALLPLAVLSIILIVSETIGISVGGGGGGYPPRPLNLASPLVWCGWPKLSHGFDLPTRISRISDLHPRGRTSAFNALDGKDVVMTNERRKDRRRRLRGQI